MNKLSIDYPKVLESYKRKSLLKNMIVGTALTLTLSPLLVKDFVNTNSKFLLALSGLVFSIACCKLPDTSYEEKLIKTYKETSLKQYKTVLQGEIVKHQTHLDITNQQELAYLIERLPEHQIDYFAQKYGVSPILAKYYVENEIEPDNEPEEIDFTVSKHIFENVIERIEKDESISLEWLKKALKDSCFIAGKKGSGKSYLLRWLLAGFIAQANEKDLFYVIDKHYDSEAPWINGVNETELVAKERIVDGSKAIPKIIELHNTLLNRIENKLTYKKTGSHIRVIIDEVDSYSEDEMIIISNFAKDVEYQGRKYGFSIHLGAHSIKKGEMGIDSSVLGSMLNILYPSVVLDRNSVLSGAFPALGVLKRNIDRYKSQVSKDCRVVVIGDDSEVYVSHVPPLELAKITVENEPKENEKQSIDALLEKIINWCKLCYQNHGKYPTIEHLKQVWLEETGKELDDRGTQLLKEYLSKAGIQI